MNKLKKLRDILEANRNNSYVHSFAVPSLWLEQFDNPSNLIYTNPYQFFLDRIDRIFELADSHLRLQSNRITVYNMFVRYATAFDHQGVGEIENVAGSFSNTGTFLKALALLPYIKHLGVNTIYFLPVTSIGQSGNKGNLGSPYSIKNPYKFDPNLAEPMIEMTVEEQFSAYVEAAHSLGIKVILEFVFRTASLDNDIALEHPDWFYWIKNSEKPFKPPTFDDKTLTIIKQKIKENDFSELPPPSDEYIDLFQQTPKSVFMDNGKICGIAADGSKLRIPNAFADWPPDDNQPLWSDVTYLKIFDHTNFNYMAYNTIRMYDEDYAQPINENLELWEYIANIIPYYITNYNIDGVMIDMGHSLPNKLRSEIVDRARTLRHNFIFWEENFMVTAQSKLEGYDAVLGYMPFDFHFPQKVKDIVNDFALNSFPIDFFLTAETHNTKRAASRGAGINFSKLAWLIASFLPSIRFLHSGFELGEQVPVNTGLGFTIDEISKFPPELLPLFSALAMNWLSKDTIIEHIQLVNKAVQTIEDHKISKKDSSNNAMQTYQTINPNAIAFGIDNALILCNFGNEELTEEIVLPYKSFKIHLLDNFSSKYCVDENRLKFSLGGYQSVIAMIEEL